MVTDFSFDIEQCVHALINGDVILYPTDTIWGLGCDATNSSAVEKLMSIKGKAPNRGLIILVASERDVLQYVADPDPTVFEYLSTVVKPTTIIYDNGLNVAEEVLHADGSIGIRVVKDEFCKHLIKRFQKPVISTSANIHGQPSPQNFSAISQQIQSAVGYIVKLRRNEESLTQGSSIVRWKNQKPQVIRP